MRLFCPNCQTEYEVPEAALAGGQRILRCGRCAHQWPRVRPLEPDAPDIASAPDVADAPGAPEILPEAALAAAEEPALADMTLVAAAPAAVAAPVQASGWGQPPRSRLAPSRQLPPPPPKRSAGRLLVLLVIVLVVIFGLIEHAAIMRSWPGSAGFFHALGL